MNHYLILYSSRSVCGGQGTWLTRKSCQMNGPANHSNHKLLYSTVANVYVLKGFAKPYWYKRNPPMLHWNWSFWIESSCLGDKGMEKLCITVVALLALMYSRGGFCYTLPDIPLPCKCARINSLGRNVPCDFKNKKIILFSCWNTSSSLHKSVSQVVSSTVT